MNLFKYLEESLPNDHSKQTNSSTLVKNYVKIGFYPKKMLDFGCGDGTSFNFFKIELPKTKFVGVDVALTGVKIHKETKTKIHPYDGQVFPFKDNSFDFVYSHQALEYTLQPQNTLSEIARVLNPNGFLIGQSSQFEPFNSLTLWNFTIYGFKRMIEEAGMKLIELRPGIDGLTLMERSYTLDFHKYNRYFNIESPTNSEIEQTSSQRQLSNRMINYKKLLVSGQFCFICSLK